MVTYRSYKTQNIFQDFKTSTKKSSSESLTKTYTTPKSPQSSADFRFPQVETNSLSLKHGGLRLVVNFPPQTTVKLRSGQTERVLQTEYCTCSRASDKTSVSD